MDGRTGMWNMWPTLLVCFLLLEGIQLAESEKPLYNIRVKIGNQPYENILGVNAKIKTDANKSQQLEIRGAIEASVKAAFDKLKTANLFSIQIQNVKEANWVPFPCLTLESVENVTERTFKFNTNAKEKKKYFFVMKSAVHQGLRVGSSASIGKKNSMEDTHTHILSVPRNDNSSFFGVYDGHNGSSVAVHARDHLHETIFQDDAYKKNPAGALKNGFLKYDATLRGIAEVDKNQGSAANVVIIRANTIYCANLGDSRAIASVADSVVPLSQDHKPINVDEYVRIISAGGKVSQGGINSNISTSRAFGDFDFKANDGKPAEAQMISPSPDIVETKITDDFEFVLLACDGVWDVMTNEEVQDFVRTRIIQRKEPEDICAELIQECLEPIAPERVATRDNMTAILVCFLRDKNYQQFCERVEGTRGKAPAPIPNNPVAPKQFIFRNLLNPNNYGLEFRGTFKFDKIVFVGGVKNFRATLTLQNAEPKLIAEITKLANVNKDRPNRKSYSFMEVKFGDEFYNVTDVQVDENEVITFKSVGRYTPPMCHLTISAVMPLARSVVDDVIIKASMAKEWLSGRNADTIQIWETFPNGINNPHEKTLVQLQKELEDASEKGQLWMIEVDGDKLDIGAPVVKPENIWKRIKFASITGKMMGKAVVRGYEDAIIFVDYNYL